MPTTEITTDAMEVLLFVKQQVPLLASEKMNAIGIKRNGQLQAGVLYERWTPKAVWMHIAAAPGGRWLTREYLYLCFAYPFLQMGVERLFAFVDAGNAASRRFLEHLGYQRVALLEGAAQDGGSAIIYSMTKGQCRFLGKEFT